MRSAEEIEQWLCRYVARLIGRPPEQVDRSLPFSRFGMDSSAAVGMAGDLEEWLGFEIEPTLPFDHPTIAALSERLARSSEDAS